MLLLHVYHIIMDSLGLSVIFDLPQTRIERVLSISFQVAVDFDLHWVGDAVDSPWIFGEYLLSLLLLALDLVLALPPVRIDYSFVLILECVQGRLFLSVVDVLLSDSFAPLAGWTTSRSAA